MKIHFRLFSSHINLERKKSFINIHNLNRCKKCVKAGALSPIIKIFQGSMKMKILYDLGIFNSIHEKNWWIQILHCRDGERFGEPFIDDYISTQEQVSHGILSWHVSVYNYGRKDISRPWLSSYLKILALPMLCHYNYTPRKRSLGGI